MMKTQLKQKKIQTLVVCIALMGVSAFTPVQAFAADEAILFGSESYEWSTGSESDIGIYATSDEVIEQAEYTVVFDPAYLTFDSDEEDDAIGADGRLRVSVDGNDTNVLRTTLTFTPKIGGTTKISVEDIVITTEEGEVSVGDGVSTPVHVQPDADCALTDLLVNGISVFSDGTEDYSLTVSGRVESAEIQTIPEDIPVQISDTALAEGENTIRVVTGEEGGEQAQYVLHITRESGGGAAIADQTADAADQQAVSEPAGTQKPPSEAAQRFREIFQNNLVLIIVIWAIAIAFVIFGIVRIQRKRQQKMEKAEQYHRERIRLAEERRLRDREALAAVEDLTDEGEPVEADAVQQTAAAKQQVQATATAVMPEENDERPEEEEKKPEIRVSHVTMDFKREKDESTSVKEMVIRTLKGQREIVKFRALDDVSFDVYKGEIVGIIGTNGSGKSTILKIISGALSPSKGKVEVNRSKLQLLTLGTGFDMELTGRENVYLNGSIIGYTKEYIDEVYDDIVKFAELEGFMDEKVRNYSSGMVSRLGFAIATTRDAPDILILDEVLSVGDMFFRKKSEQRIREMMHSGCTVLIVSHSTGVIEKNCTKAVWIEKGKLRMVGDPKVVCKAYTELTNEEN